MTSPADDFPNDEDRRKVDEGRALLLTSAVGLFVSRHMQGDPSDIIAGGSGTLIHTGSAALLVTADHVVEAIVNMPDDGYLFVTSGTLPDGQVRTIDGRYPKPEALNMIVDRSDRLDIATLRIEAVDAINPSSFYRHLEHHASWAIPRVSVGDPVSLVGFPGQDQTRSSSHLDLGISYFVGEVHSSSDSGFTIDSDWDFFENPQDAAAQKESFDPGGMSGAVIFSYRTPLVPVGVLTESPDQGTFPILRASHLDVMEPDGRFDRTNIAFLG